MALWGISTTTETEANNYAIPKFQQSVDRNRSPWNTFADTRGWIQRHYGTSEHSGLSTNYYDEVLVPVVGLNTGSQVAGDPGENNTGIGSATPVAIFFEDPNQNSPISLGAGGTDKFSTTGTAYVHLVYNENVYCSAGATIRLLRSTGAAVVATAGSATYNADLPTYTNNDGLVLERNFNGQISNRVAFAFTASGSGVGTVFSIDLAAGVVGTITDFYRGGVALKVLSNDILMNVGGAGTYLSGVGIGTTTLTLA